MKIKIILFFILSVILSCNNYQSFSSRKYLPKFKKTSKNEEQVVAQQKSSESLNGSSSPISTIQTIDSSDLYSEPVLFAELNSNNKSINAETKKVRYWNNE